MREIIKEWRNKRGFTFRFMADLLGLSVGHMGNYYHARIGVSEDVVKNAKDINKIILLIDGEPKDMILLKYELSQLTGLTMEELEKGQSKAVRRIERNASQMTPEEPSSLRKLTIKTLERLRDNGYKSVYRSNVSYDPQEVEAEIARKKFNIKRKKEIWEEKLALNA